LKPVSRHLAAAPIPLHTGSTRGNRAVRHAVPDPFPEPDGRRPKDATDGKRFPNLDHSGKFPSRPTVRAAWRAECGRLPTRSDVWHPEGRTVCGPRWPVAFPNARAATARNLVPTFRASRPVDRPPRDSSAPTPRGRPHHRLTANTVEEGCLDVDALLQLQSHSRALTITYSSGTVNC
jgi:hypothetical protein